MSTETNVLAAADFAAILSSTSTALSTGAWHHIVIIFASGTTVKLFVDGSSVGDGTGGPLTQVSEKLYINGNSAGTNLSHTDVYCDEVRQRSVAVNADWVTAEYNNLKASSTLIAFGTFSQAPASTLRRPPVII